VFGALLITQAFAPLLRKTTIPGYTKRITYVSSLAGVFGIPTIGSYVASKHALEGLADVFRAELQSWGIDVTVAQLGSIETERGTGNRQDIKKEVSSTHGDAVSDKYAAMGGAMLSQSDKFELLTPASKIAMLIEDSLLDTVPKTRYRGGWDAFFLAPLLSLLPDRILDLFLGAAFRG